MFVQSKVNIGVIGVGNIARRVYFPILAERHDVNLVAICDINEENLDRVFTQFNAKEKFTDYTHMIKKVPLDAVFIFTPPPVTADAALNCLSEGLNVFIEKPPGTNLEETKKLARLAKKKGCKTMVGFNRRFCPLIRKAKEMVERKGQIVQALATFHKKVGYGDDLVWDIIHSIDTLRYICGEPKKLISKISKLQSNRANSFNSIIEFENNCIGILSCYRTSGTRYERFEIHGKNVAAYIRPLQYAKLYEDDKCILLEESKLVAFRYAYGYFDEVNRFIEGIKQDKEIDENNIFDALKTMRLVHAIREFQNQNFISLGGM